MGNQNGQIHISLQTLKILEALLGNPNAPLSGADIHQHSHIASGTLYPILLRLEAAGWCTSTWELIDPTGAGRPRRRLYRLTSAGLRKASDVFASSNQGVLA